MLSGTVPFQTFNNEDSAASIMKRIKEGQFNFSALEWKDVSEQAKDLIQGELDLRLRSRIHSYLIELNIFYCSNIKQWDNSQVITNLFDCW